MNHWQLYDWRNGRNLQQRLQSLPEDKLLFLAFRRETLEEGQISEWAHPLVCLEDDQPDPLQFESRYVVLLDLPYDKGHLEAMFAERCMPARIYAVFHHRDEHFFTGVPSRSHFKWFYAFLLKRKSFDLKRYSQSLAEAKGWSRESILFMVDVFSELAFITVDDGVVFVQESPEKRDLTDSEVYRDRQRQADLENDLCYSSYSSLKRYFDRLDPDLQTLEGAVN